MVEHVIAATNAHVTLDVAIPGVVWGWIITMNMWSKSIATGVIFVGAFLLARHGDDKRVKLSMPVLSLIFVHITLLFTVLDLHQIFRFWHIFVYPNWTSAITVGAWALTFFVISLFVMVYALAIKKCDDLYSKALNAAVVLAIPVTLYTAVIMAESTARELWQGPTEIVQMLLAALLAGSATMLIVLKDASEDVKKDLTIILGISTFTSLLIYLGEYYFGHMKAEEVAVILSYVKDGGEWSSFFWLAMTLGFIVPAWLAYITLRHNVTHFRLLMSISALVGLWMAKHVWLIIPQLMPLS
jgi:formate-dependent nitrite reductase membrane component NrfD